MYVVHEEREARGVAAQDDSRACDERAYHSLRVALQSGVRIPLAKTGVELQSGVTTPARRGALSGSHAYMTRHTTRVRYSRVRHSCMYTPSVYVYATRVRDVRGAATRGNNGAGVGLRGRHSTPLVYIYATRGYVTRVRIRHPCTCTPLEYVTYVELQHAAASVHTWGYVDDTAPHSCTYAPLAGTSLVYVYAIRVRVRHSST